MNARILMPVILLLFGVTQVMAQTTAFTYQGKLTDGGNPANGNYDLQFALFGGASGGAQIGQTQTVNNVSASGGVFTVTLDFGPAAFPGAARFLEISTRPSGGGAFTLLTPRQAITSTPYAVRSFSSATSDTATNAQQLGGAAAGQYVKTNDTRLTDSRPPTAGSSNYIQNTTSQQGGSNFNIGGNGTVAGTLTANKVSAAGTVESIAGGFKFPDGSVQSSAINPAIGKVYTTGQIALEAEIVHTNNIAPIISLILPPGLYFVTATITFENKANGFLQNNTRVVRCFLVNDFSVNGLGAPGSALESTTTAVHTVLTQSTTGPVSLSCGNQESAGQVFAKTRRLTAIRVADNPN